MGGSRLKKIVCRLSASLTSHASNNNISHNQSQSSNGTKTNTIISNKQVQQQQQWQQEKQQQKNNNKMTREQGHTETEFARQWHNQMIPKFTTTERKLLEHFPSLGN